MDRFAPGDEMDWRRFLPGECAQRSRIVRYLKMMRRSGESSRRIPLLPWNCDFMYVTEDGGNHVEHMGFNIQAHVVLMMKDSLCSGSVEWLRDSKTMNDLGHVIGKSLWFERMTEDEQREVCRSVLEGLAMANHRRYVGTVSPISEPFGLREVRYGGEIGEVVDETNVDVLKGLYRLASGLMTPQDAHSGHCPVHRNVDCVWCEDSSGALCARCLRRRKKDKKQKEKNGDECACSNESLERE